jgi:adenylate cyclase
MSRRQKDEDVRRLAEPRLGPVSRRLQEAYERWGPDYPKRALLAGLSTGYLTGVMATAGTALYIDMSAWEFVRLAVASWILIWTPEFVIAGWLNLKRVEPTCEWLRGDRRGEDAVGAWEAAATLALARLREPLLYAAVLPGMLLWGIYAVDQLDLPTHAIGIFFAASVLVYLYWMAARFLAMEVVMRPVTEDIGRSLPEEADIELLRVPLRWRLLASLVAVTLITGVAVGGFAASGSADIRALGFALLGSAVVAIVVSSWLIGFLSSSVTRPISQLRDAALRVGHGDLSVRVAVASTDESGELERAFNQMVAGLQQREQLRDAFGTFVDPDLTERVLAEGTDLDGDEVELSLLFMDIRGFTSYSERAEPRQVVSRLNDLYGEVVPVILRHGGHANKFIGDGLLAVFGAPNRLDDHAERAVAAGLEIASLVRQRYQGELRVGIGINSGRVVAGTIGGGGRLDFTVIGDTVNTASRVESATRETDDDLLITQATRERLSSDDRWVERPPIPLKGKSEAIRLFAPR